MKSHNISINKPSEYDGITDIFIDGKRAESCVEYSIREHAEKPLWIDITFRYFINELKINSETTDEISDTIELIDDNNGEINAEDRRKDN